MSNTYSKLAASGILLFGLATLWFINDRASSRLVSKFYRELKDPEITKAEALRRAQVSLLGDRRYRHPSYWSPFLMIGNWL